MQILFGLDLDAAKDGVADVYLEADHTAMDMDKVVSIRISLLLRSINNNVTEDPQPFTYMGTTTPTTDRFLRRVFNATSSLRNGALVSAS
jgi:type IV pilus assembly protein PilW